MEMEIPVNPDKKTQAAWLEHELSQARYFNSLSLRAKLQAVEGMADVVRRFRQLHAEGKIHSAAATVHEPGAPYAQDQS
jgi:hypothetical protein